jgi:hypothetical protein
VNPPDEPYWPVPSHVPTWLERGEDRPIQPLLQPPPLPRDRHLDAAVDRLVIAVADVCDEDAMPASSPPVDVDVVAGALARMLAGTPGPPVELMVRARLEAWADAALAVLGRHRDRPAALEELLWFVGDLVAGVAAAMRGAYSDHRAGLTWALHEVMRGLPDAGAAWSAEAERRPRFRFRALFDVGSGALLWSANDAARERWDYPVDHFDLPVPLDLALRVQALLDRYDLDHPDGYVLPVDPEEERRFRAAYGATLLALRQVLGPAYEIEDRSGLHPEPATGPVPVPEAGAAIPGRQTPRSGPAASQDRLLWAVVDRVVVAAIDVADIAVRGGGPDDEDPERDVRAAVQAMLRAGPAVPWGRAPRIAERVRERITEWADGARRLGADPEAPTRFDDHVLATGRAVVAAARSGPGLAYTLAQVRAALPDPDGAWDDALVSFRVGRLPRFRLATRLEAGSGVLLRPANPPARERWGRVVDHYELPIPLDLADDVQRVVEQGGRDRGVLHRLAGALGSAYQLVDGG